MDKLVIKLNGKGGELDSISLPWPCHDDAIKAALLELIERCTVTEGDTITFEVEA